MFKASVCSLTVLLLFKFIVKSLLFAVWSEGMGLTKLQGDYSLLGCDAM